MSALRYGGTGRQNLKKLAAPMMVPSDMNENFTYGAPLRPATPIKAVIGNFYGEIAGFEHKIRTNNQRESDENFRYSMLNPPKTHTRASAMANTFVNDSTIKKAVDDPKNTKNIFKMKKFLQVEPRTSSKNQQYKPTKREGMDKIGMRPNAVIGGK